MAARDYSKPERFTAERVAELHRLSPFDPDHLPEGILLTEAFQRRFPRLPQVACFESRFSSQVASIKWYVLNAVVGNLADVPASAKG
jgi:acetate kinase